MKKPIKSLKDLTPDRRNANRGTERGRGQLETSIRKFGFLEPGVLDKEGRIIGGNKRTEVSAELFGTDVEPVVIDTDGTRPVYVRRLDMDLETPEGREAALALNRTAQVSIDFDPEELARLQVEGVGTEDWFTEQELDLLAANVHPEEWASALGGLPNGDKSPFEQMTFTLHAEQAERVREALRNAKAEGPMEDSPNENSNGNALTRICEAYLDALR